jgi:hypothetical protein
MKAGKRLVGEEAAIEMGFSRVTVPKGQVRFDGKGLR